MDKLFNSIFQNESQSTLSVYKFLFCLLVSLIIGVSYFFSYNFKNKNNKTMSLSLFILPSVVSVIIMMVNGNLGIGVAIAGAFSLVRFRTVGGSAYDISVIFMAMTSGLIVGVGYLAYGVLFTIIMDLLIIMVNFYNFRKKKQTLERIIKITIPEDLNYPDIFQDTFEKSLEKFELQQVKTLNLGSLMRLTYLVTLKKDSNEKELIDEIRIKNGNLEVVISLVDNSSNNNL